MSEPESTDGKLALVLLFIKKPTPGPEGKLGSFAIFTALQQETSTFLSLLSRRRMGMSGVIKYVVCPVHGSRRTDYSHGPLPLVKQVADVLECVLKGSEPAGHETTYTVSITSPILFGPIRPKCISSNSLCQLLRVWPRSSSSTSFIFNS